MITIKKGKEPKEWTEKVNTEGFTKYEPIAELREALLKDQGNICAYCMREVPVGKRDINIPETSKIEHIKSRHRYPDDQLDYGNMVICCPGFIDGDTHCDKSKDRDDISFSPFDPKVQMSITYGSKDGTIRSKIKSWDDDINQRLRLNNATLKLNRANVLKGTIEVLNRKKWKKAELQAQLDEWKKPNREDRLRPYCGIVIAFLEKKK